MVKFKIHAKLPDQNIIANIQGFQRSDGYKRIIIWTPISANYYIDMGARDTIILSDNQEAKQKQNNVE